MVSNALTGDWDVDTFSLCLQEILMVRWFILHAVLVISASGWAIQVAADLAGSPNLHTTTLEVAADLNPPAPGKLVIDLVCMDGDEWRAEQTVG